MRRLLQDRYRVVRFDRRNLRPTLRSEAMRLAGLAEAAGGPVVVVAHSVAALHAEAFARLRPELVCGLVLVDPSCEVRTPSPPRCARWPGGSAAGWSRRSPAPPDRRCAAPWCAARPSPAATRRLGKRSAGTTATGRSSAPRRPSWPATTPWSPTCTRCAGGHPSHRSAWWC
ncbi:alpha/beta fold hydrolase [Nocardiopsis composta]